MINSKAKRQLYTLAGISPAGDDELALSVI